MTSTPHLAQLAALADHHQWRIVLLGDPRQFSAVGRSGMFGLLVDSHGAVELDHIHRFTHHWERDASLRLRAGDVTVLDDYAAHHRIHEGHRHAAERWAIRSWETARRHGETVALLAPSNDTVVRLNQTAQHARVAAGELGHQTLAAGPYRLRVGDEIATRRNDRQLHTDRGLMVKNRDTWTIDEIHRGGGLTVTGRTGTVRLPAAYVREQVELAYAQTSHAAQGRTVDRSLLFLDAPTDVRGVYVPMTRGRASNEVFVVTDGTRTARDVLAEALTQDWIDNPATVRRAELAAATRLRQAQDRAPIPRLDIRELLETEHQLRREIERYETARAETRRRLAELEPWRGHLVAEQTDAGRRLTAAQAVLDRHDRPLHRWGHRDEITAARKTVDTLERAIPNRQRRLDELRAEIDQLRTRARASTGNDPTGTAGSPSSTRPAAPSPPTSPTAATTPPRTRPPRASSDPAPPTHVTPPSGTTLRRSSTNTTTPSTATSPAGSTGSNADTTAPTPPANAAPTTSSNSSSRPSTPNTDAATDPNSTSASRCRGTAQASRAPVLAHGSGRSTTTPAPRHSESTIKDRRAARRHEPVRCESGPGRRERSRSGRRATVGRVAACEPDRQQPPLRRVPRSGPSAGEAVRSRASSRARAPRTCHERCGGWRLGSSRNPATAGSQPEQHRRGTPSAAMTRYPREMSVFCGRLPASPIICRRARVEYAVAADRSLSGLFCRSVPACFHQSLQPLDRQLTRRGRRRTNGGPTRPPTFRSALVTARAQAHYESVHGGCCPDSLALGRLPASRSGPVSMRDDVAFPRWTWEDSVLTRAQTKAIVVVAFMAVVGTLIALRPWTPGGGTVVATDAMSPAAAPVAPLNAQLDPTPASLTGPAIVFTDSRQGFALPVTHMLGAQDSPSIRIPPAAHQFTLIRTVDGGTTWSPTGLTAELSGIFFVDQQHGWILGPNVLYSTGDSGASWKLLTEPPSYLVVIYFSTATDGWGVTAAGQVVRTSDGGVTWQNIGTTIKPADSYCVSSGGIWVARPEGVSVSIDGGASWQQSFVTPAEWDAQTATVRCSEGSIWSAFALPPGTGARPIIVERSSDGGKSWSPVVTSSATPRPLFSLRGGPMVASNAGSLYFAANCAICNSSIDNGLGVVTVGVTTGSAPTTTEFPSGAVQAEDITITPDGRLVLLVSRVQDARTSVSALFESSDQGRSWQRRDQAGFQQ